MNWMRIQVKKMYYVPYKNYKQDYMNNNGSQVYDMSSNCNSYSFDINGYKFSNNYNKISMIEQNSKVINKYLNSLTGENIIKRDYN